MTLPRALPLYRLRDDDPVLAVLRHAQSLLVKHPVAAQALFSAFTAEGRAYARTPDGQRWKRRLVDSELIRRGRVLWEVGTLNILEETPSGPIPSRIADAMVLALSRADLEGLLRHLFSLYPEPGETSAHPSAAVPEESSC